ALAAKRGHGGKAVGSGHADALGLVGVGEGDGFLDDLFGGHEQVGPDSADQCRGSTSAGSCDLGPGYVARGHKISISEWDDAHKFGPAGRSRGAAWARR